MKEQLLFLFHYIYFSKVFPLLGIIEKAVTSGFVSAKPI